MIFHGYLYIITSHTCVLLRTAVKYPFPLLDLAIASDVALSEGLLVTREHLELCLIDLLQLWTAELRDNAADSILERSEDRAENKISLDLSGGLQ